VGQIKSKMPQFNLKINKKVAVPMRKIVRSNCLFDKTILPPLFRIRMKDPNIEATAEMVINEVKLISKMLKAHPINW
jgi:hypothetical protein